ncbi:uncharacterized protein LOC111625992 [Centruroides sculpturatus]|uniref:uncharacterized protein LOC111625992 n=1 Tax=Centruroides sculpturatus TaxID=218467 RepID=UPI000C6D73B8|nr:uncharacterized protein LOC111625992 [Centruroides sculpturatus]
MPITQFWIKVKSEYPVLHEKAVRMLLPFSTTYLCESTFSAMMGIRNCSENDGFLNPSNALISSDQMPTFNPNCPITERSALDDLVSKIVDEDQYSNNGLAEHPETFALYSNNDVFSTFDGFPYNNMWSGGNYNVGKKRVSQNFGIQNTLNYGDTGSGDKSGNFRNFTNDYYEPFFNTENDVTVYQGKNKLYNTQN